MNLHTIITNTFSAQHIELLCMGLTQDMLTEDGLSDYWSWVTATLFILLPIDLLMTYTASEIVGVNGEVNPIMRWLIQQDLVVVIGIHLGILIVIVGIFALYKRIAEWSPKYTSIMLHSMRAYLVLMIAGGFVVFLSNLIVILSNI